MKTKIRLGIGVIVLACNVGANAAMMLEATVIGQSQQQTQAGAVIACGITIAAIEVTPGQPTGRSLIFNGSLMIYSPNGGVVKGRVSDMDSKAIAAGNFDFSRIKVLPSENFWIKAPNAPATEPRTGSDVSNSEDPGYKYYLSDFDSIWSVIQAVLEKRPIQVGFKLKGRTAEQVLFGELQMTDAQRGQLDQCLAEWAKGIAPK